MNFEGIGNMLEGLERGLEVLLAEARAFSVVLDADFVDGLARAFTEAPLHLCSKMLQPLFRGID